MIIVELSQDGAKVRNWGVLREGYVPIAEFKGPGCPKKSDSIDSDRFPSPLNFS